MDFGNIRNQQFETTRAMTYQGTNYSFERKKNRSLVIDVEDSSTDAPLGNATEFKINLFEPMIIDKLSDIYLDSFITHNCLNTHSTDTMAFSLNINEFNIQTNACSSNNDKNRLHKNILIPNENNDAQNVHTSVIHKGKKLNYVGTINPCKLNSISGSIKSLSGNSMFANVDTTNGNLCQIEIDSGLTTGISAGTAIILNYGSSPGINVTGSTYIYHLKDSTIIYFQLTNNNISITQLQSSNTIQINGVTYNHLSGQERIGDPPKFIAEFTLMDRD